jgi:SAM-dependent methyltransferase
VAYRGADFEGADILIHRNGEVAAADRSADIVLSFQVLEHVADVGRYLGEAKRILRENGWLILSTHGTWLYHPHPEDHRRWTREGLLAEMSSNGFETRECVPILGPLAWTTLLRLICGYQVLLRVPVLGRMLARILALVMNGRGYLEDLLTPDWVRRDNACVYVTLSRAARRPP